MTPIQIAICQVIREHGFVDHALVALSRCAHDRVTRGSYDNKWFVRVDGHVLTQREYEEWAKQQS